MKSQMKNYWYKMNLYCIKFSKFTNISDLFTNLKYINFHIL